MVFRRGRLVLVVATALALLAAPVAARERKHGSSQSSSSWHSTTHVTSGKSHHGSSSGHHHATASATKHATKHSSATSGVKRDSHGKIKRSQEAKKAFLHQHGMTHVPKGYEVDHKVPLCAGGRDDPSNMQLLSKSEHRAKTRGDVKACRRR